MIEGLSKPMVGPHSLSDAENSKEILKKSFTHKYLKLSTKTAAEKTCILEIGRQYKRSDIKYTYIE